MSAMMWLALLLASPELPDVEVVAVNSVTGAKVAGVKIEVIHAGYQPLGGVTDAAGQYILRGLEPGEYQARFYAPKFTSPDPISFRVVAGSDTPHLEVRLVPQGKIHGRVVNRELRPVPGITVELTVAKPSGPLITRTGSTGEFTFDDLPPGGYYLGARPSWRGGAERESPIAPPAAEKGERLTLAPTWYPAATSRRDAARIAVGAGADLDNFELRLRAVPVHRLQGVVVDQGGRPAAKAAVALFQAGVYHVPEYRTVSGEDGSFTFDSVWDGAWRIQADVGNRGTMPRGFAEVIVSGGDIDAVRLSLRQPFTLEARVEFDQQDEAKGSAIKSTVQLIPLAAYPQQVLNASPDNTGHMQFKGVYPGRYGVEPGSPPEAYVTAVLLGDRDVLGQEVELDAGAPTLRIVYRAHPGVVRGTVEDGRGAWVVMIPRDEALNNRAFIRSARCDANGRFEIGGLRPGRYYTVAGRSQSDQDALDDPECFRAMVPRAATVEVREGEVSSADLRLGTACGF